MGYIHNTGMCVWVPGNLMQVDAGSWSDVVTSNVWQRRRAAGAGSFTVKIPGMLPHQNSQAQRGSYLQSVDIWYLMIGGVLTTLDAYLYRITLPAHGTAWPAVTAISFIYDSDHDTNIERCAENYHKMTLTPLQAFWVQNTEFAQVELVCQAGASGNWGLCGARFNYTLRI